METLLLRVIIILLALQCSTANGHEGNIGTNKKMLPAKIPDFFQQNDGWDVIVADANGRKGVVSRKMLKEVDVEKSGEKDEISEQKERNHNRTQAEEVANLMHRDYKGADGSWRRSPINNQEPTD